MDDLSIPDNVRELAMNAADSLLPVKSRGRYEKAFQAFESWKNSNKISSDIYTEPVFLAYLVELSRKYAGSTLWTTYSMLHKIMEVNLGINIGSFPKLQAFLKQRSVGHVAKKSEVFSRDSIKEFLKRADNKDNLHIKVVALFSLFGACRKSEIIALNTDDVDDMGPHLRINIRQSKTGPRSFLVLGNEDRELDALTYFKDYFSLRPKEAPARLFLGLRNGKCTKQPIGRNTLATYPRKIAEFLGLENPKAYTSHCFRRSSATWLADSGVDVINLKRFGGWKSDTVAQGYVANSVANKTSLAMMVQCGDNRQQVHLSSGAAMRSHGALNISGCQDCVFNINISPKQ